MLLQCYDNLCLEFLFVHRYSSFGVILCLRVFSSVISFLKFKTFFIGKYFLEISLALMLDVLLEFLKLCVTVAYEIGGC